jgi:hypothetical protein
MPSTRAIVATVAAVAVALVSRGYEDNTAQWKLDFLWTNVELDLSSGSFMNPIQTLALVAQKSYLMAMTDTHEDIRQGHKKATHGIGAHAKAHFEWKSNEYTGMFQQADHCVIRMANAAHPGTLAMTAYGPNMAVKCFRDGIESANMQFIWQIDGYAVMPAGTKKSCSYFEAPLCNHNPLRDDIDMALKDTFIGFFNEVDPHSMLLGVSQMATHSQDGSKVDNPNFPFALVLNPTKALNEVKCDFNNFTSQLMNLNAAGLAAPGKVLYDVHVAHDPATNGPDATTLKHIGSLVLDSPFTTSMFGDTELFFRHTFFQEELDTLSAVDADRAAAWSTYVSSEDNYKREGASLYWPYLPTVQAKVTV